MHSSEAVRIDDSEPEFTSCGCMHTVLVFKLFESHFNTIYPLSAFILRVPVLDTWVSDQKYAHKQKRECRVSSRNEVSERRFFN